MKKLFVLICIAFLLLQFGCSKGQNEMPRDDHQGEGFAEGSIQDQGSVYLHDAKELISVVEATHPAFVLDDISDNYEQVKQELLGSASKVANKDEFSYLVQKYLTTLQDAHTKVQKNQNAMFLDIDCRAVGDELYIINENGRISDKRITHIGGVSIDGIFATVGEYYVAENEAANDNNNSIWSLNYEVLKLAGCDIDDNCTKIDIEQNDKTYDKEIKFKSRNLYGNYNFSTEIKSKMIEDILYIDMNICNDNKTLEKQAKKVKDSIKNGTTKIIIDVRDNPGGNSNACEKLLKAMGMKVPSFGVYIRYSELAHSTYKNMPAKGYKQLDPDKTTAKRNDDIELVVLTNAGTFSSATMLASYVKDGGLGTVIGTPSSNAPSSYGDILYYKLPNSGVEVTISFKRFLRPDTEADPRILMPDIVTDHNTDALEAAIEYLSSK